MASSGAMKSETTPGKAKSIFSSETVSMVKLATQQRGSAQTTKRGPGPG